MQPDVSTMTQQSIRVNKKNVRKEMKVQRDEMENSCYEQSDVRTSLVQRI